MRKIRIKSYIQCLAYIDFDMDVVNRKIYRRSERRKEGVSFWQDDEISLIISLANVKFTLISRIDSTLCFVTYDLSRKQQ